MTAMTTASAVAAKVARATLAPLQSTRTLGASLPEQVPEGPELVWAGEPEQSDEA